MSATAVVVGASGFSGGEVLRILSGHPALSVIAAGGHSSAGASVQDVQPHLIGAIDSQLLDIESALATEADVCFTCLPSGSFAALGGAAAAPTVVDLADDFRAASEWVYGLTEFARDDIAGARLISNPGCYPTAALLCLVPFARAEMIEGPIVIDALSGTSGAGRKEADQLLLATADSSVSAYGTSEHRHVPEIEQGLRVFGGLDIPVSFTPHLVPMARGLLVTARARMTSELSDARAGEVLADAYAKEHFVQVLTDWPRTKSVAGTNRAHVSARVDRRNGWLICSAAIDNLGKGAAGQAVQNANVALGLDESLGLDAWGVWP